MYEIFVYLSFTNVFRRQRAAWHIWRHTMHRYPSPGVLHLSSWLPGSTTVGCIVIALHILIGGIDLHVNSFGETCVN